MKTFIFIVVLVMMFAFVPADNADATIVPIGEELIADMNEVVELFPTEAFMGTFTGDFNVMHTAQIPSEITGNARNLYIGEWTFRMKSSCEIRDNFVR